MGIALESLAGLLVLLLCVAYGAALRRVLRLRFRAILSPELAEPSDLPPDVSNLLETQGRELESLGFERFALLREADVVDFVDEPAWTSVYRGDRDFAFAFLAMSLEPTRAHPCTVTFRSFDDAGQVIETVGAAPSSDRRDRPGHTLIEAGTPSVREQCERHRSEVAARSDFAARDLGRDELVVECADGYKKALEALVASGALVRGADGRARAPLRAALRQVLRANPAAPKRSARASESETPLETGDVTAEVWAHRRRDALGRSRPAGWVRKLAIFVVSVCAFAIAFGLQLSPQNVAVLFAVLLIHELGHALAMKWFGYRDLQILFIPFLGAVASGEKRDTKPYQEILVLLAGPVPGILVGGAVLGSDFAEQTPWLADAATMMLIVNYINLLPVMPLDGGRVMNVALFDRFPRLRIAFTAASALAILYAGSALDDRVLHGLGLIVAIGLPGQVTRGRLLASVRARLAQLAPAEVSPDPLPAVYTELRSPKFASWNSETRYQAVVELISRIVRRPAGAGLAFVTIAGWAAMLVLPLGLIQYRATARIEAALAEEEAAQARMSAEWDAKVAGAATPSDKARAHVGAAAALFEVSRLEDASRHLEAARPLLDPAADPELEATRQLLLGRIDVYSLDDAGGGKRVSAGRHLQRALDLREQRFGPESLEVAEILEAFPIEEPGERAAALMRQMRLTSIYERSLAADPSLADRLIAACHAEASLRHQSRDFARAEAALRHAVEVAAGASEERRADAQSDALAELSEFYFATERYADVRALLGEREKVGPTAVTRFFGLDPDLESDRCWLPYWEGDSEAARACFAALHARVSSAGVTSPGAATIVTPLALDAIAATARAGDEAGARRLLAELRAAAERPGDLPFDSYLKIALRTASGRGSLRFAEEGGRRLDERSRLVLPLLGPERDTPAL